MNRDTAVSRIRQILGFRSDLQSEAEGALIEAQEDAENGELGFLPWFLRRTFRDTLARGSVNFYLPKDFIREYEHERYSLWIGGVGPGTRVPFVATDRRGAYTDGRVAYYIEEVEEEGLTRSRVVFDLEFDTDVCVELLYYKRDIVLNSNIENGWLENGSKYLIGLAGMKLAGVRDITSMQEFMKMQQAGSAALLRQDTAYRTGSSKFQFGGVEERIIPPTGRRYLETSNIRYNDLDTGD